MNTTECSRAMEWIDADVDAELTATDHDWLTSHVDRCPRCKAHRDLALVVKQSVQRSSRPVATPDPVRQRIVSQIAMTSETYRAQIVVRRTIRVEIREIDE